MVVALGFGCLSSAPSATAAGGSPVAGTLAAAAQVFAAAAAVSTPVDLPKNTTGRLVFAHYFPPYPIAIENVDPTKDYYALNYVTPAPTAANEKQHSVYGGLLRDRPIPTAPKPAGVDFELENLKTEVRQAMAAGIDGFAVCILGDAASPDQNNWRWTVKLLKAAKAVSSSFKIMLQPDTDSTAGFSQSRLAADLASLATDPATASAVYRLKGKVVISPFDAQTRSASWWKGLLSTFTAKTGKAKLGTAFIPLLSDWNSVSNSSWKNISIGYGDWGPRDPAETAGVAKAKMASKSHALKKLWMQAVAVQDSRPNHGIFQEAQNTATLRKTWELAINEKADLVLLTTWNDYSETTSFAPSVQHGWSVLDISRYYIAWYRTGKAPKLTRDTLFLSNRVQKWGLKITPKTYPGYAPYTQFMVWRGTKEPGWAGSKPWDQIEVLGMLTKASTVRIFANGKKLRDCSLKPGVQSCTTPWQPGVISAAIMSGSTRTSVVSTKEAAVTSRSVQDLGYRYASSRR